MKVRKKYQSRKEANYKESDDNYYSNKEKEYLIKYKNIAGEYLDDLEFIDLFKKYNYDDQQISKEIEKIKLGDDYKWKEIKNGKPVSTRSTDKIHQKQTHNFHYEKSYPSHDKSDYESKDKLNKRKQKGSYQKPYKDFYHYGSKKPKRPFQKCIEVPSDYLPQRSNYISKTNNNEEKIEKDNIEKETFDNAKKSDNVDKKIEEIDLIKDKENKINTSNRKEEEKNNEEKDIDTLKRNEILIKDKAFKRIKRFKTNTDIKNKDKKNNEIFSEKENTNYNNNILIYDIKNNKALRKEYLRNGFGNIKNYSKKIENNIKRANSKGSETSEDKSPEIKKRAEKNFIVTNNNNIIQKKNKIINNDESEINPSKKEKIIFIESKVADFSINSCYDNPYRAQYLKIIKQKKEQNPGKNIEFVVPQFNAPFIPPYMYQSQFTPYQSMYMYPSQVNNVPLYYPIPQKIPQNNEQYINQNCQRIISPINSPNNSKNGEISPQVNQQIKNILFNANNI